MKNPEHTKPFNPEHAKAGAPYALATGEGVDILKWDRKHAQCIVTVSHQDAAVRTYRADGTQGHGDGKFDLVMTPLGYLEGKPVFVGDELVTPTGMKWVTTPTCRVEHGRSLADCCWPAPEKQYPETGMSGEELENAFNNAYATRITGALTAVANAALRHAIDNGQVAPKEAYDLCSRDLGKAERLLESLGYRSTSSGDWTPLAVQEMPTEDLFLQNLRALEKSGRNTGEHAAVIRAFRSAVNDVPHVRAVRDMAVAEAVRDACVAEIGNRNRIVKTNHLADCVGDIHLAAIIAGVKA